MNSDRLETTPAPRTCDAVHSESGLTCTQSRNGHTIHLATDQERRVMHCWASLKDFLPAGFSLALDRKLTND